MTLRDVAFVPGVLFDLCSFNVVQEEHVITPDRTGAHMLDGHVLFRKGKVGKYVDATRVAKHEQLPALVTVPALPQPTSSAQPRPRVSPAVTRSASRQHPPPVTDPSESSPESPLLASSVMQRREAPVAGALPEPPPPPQPPKVLVTGAPPEPPPVVTAGGT